MAQLFIVEKVDGHWEITRSTPWRERFHLVPKVQPPGVITLGKFVYVVDPNCRRRIPFKPKRYLKLFTDYNYVYLWREGDPEPRPLFAAPKRDDDITGLVMSEVAKNKRIRDLVTPATDWKDLALILCIVGMIVLGIALYSVAQGGHA